MEGKLKPQATSQHYAWNERTKERQKELDLMGVDNRPQPVRAGDISSNGAKSPLGSAWNSAGTWEERDVSKNACDLFKTMLESFTHNAGGKEVSFSEARAVGNVNLIASRGKLKVGFELDLTAKWEVRTGGDGESLAKGTLKASLEDSDCDFFTAFSPTKDQGTISVGEAISLVKLTQDPLKKVVVKAWMLKLVEPPP